MMSGTSSKRRQKFPNPTREETRIYQDRHTCTRENLRKQISYLYGEDTFLLTRTYEKLEVQRATILCDLKFLRNCRDRNLIPKCCQLKFHSKTPSTERILKRTELALIRNELHRKRFLLDQTNKDLLSLHLKLSNRIHPILWDKSKQLAFWRAETETSLNTDIHTRKLNNLEKHQKPKPFPQQLKNTVHNISDRTLTTAETNVLSKGFNFAVAPKRIPTENIICGVEATLTKINQDEANKIRLEVTNVLCSSIPPRSNLHKDEQKALTNLRKDNNIIILPADKGNATVVMNTSDYQDKLSNLLQDPAYKPLTTDPTTYLEKTTKSKIKASPISQEIQQRIIPREKSSRCPKLYGLPKIHKEGTPLRPIVSSIGSPLQNLAKFLAKQLQPYAESIMSHVQNSFHFIEIIKEQNLQPSDLLVSFDVISLFTQVPIKEALTAIQNKYNPPKHILDLTNHCLMNTYFIHNGQRYKQIEGAPMGSPLSPVIANLYMEYFETNALDKSEYKPKLWLRYVDDTFVIWPHGKEKLDSFLTHLNSLHPKIQFTMEIETNNKLPFLDVLIYKKTDGSLGHTVYQKKTHTNRYLNAKSHHHPAQINSVAKTLISRTKRLADKDHLEPELHSLTNVLISNGFQREAINNLIQKETPPKNQDTEQDNGIALLPYIKGTTDKISKILRKHNIKTAFGTDKKIANILRNPKDNIQLENQGVYQIPCKICPATYIGQTNRRVNARVAEHKNALKKKEKTSSLFQHFKTTGHEIDFDSTKLISKTEHYNKRIIREAIEIEKHPQNMNKRDDTSRLPDIWKPALKSIPATETRLRTHIVKQSRNLQVPTTQDITPNLQPLTNQHTSATSTTPIVTPLTHQEVSTQQAIAEPSNHTQPPVFIEGMQLRSRSSHLRSRRETPA